MSKSVYGENQGYDEFIKHDDNKLRYSLIPADVLQGVVKVLERGALKYGRDNWKLCQDKDRYYNAAMRHLEAWRSGEFLDKETNEPHINHAIASLVFISHLDRQNL